MKIGMIGIGDIAKKAYLPVLSQTKGIELHVCTRNKDTLREISATYQVPYLYHDIDQWLTSGITAAFVHSSTESHEAIIDKLLDHGIHVYVDKPITYDGDSTTRLMDKAESKGLILMVGFNRRYAPPYMKLKELEEPNMVIMQKNRGHQADDIRTFIFDDFIHVIDTLLYLFPYAIEDIKIQGKKMDGKLHHVILQLEAKQGTAIGIMNREAGTTEEKVEVMSATETRTVMNVNEVTSHIDKNIFTYGTDDWQPTLHKRGFHHIISTFLSAVKNNLAPDKQYQSDLEAHLIAEKIVQSLVD
ncbi:Gfo/Idh/MocA family protein [Lederbergia lenta]|uniref:Gfo/Idh/MocA family protein n=1 Tax=Lederbergia lenta TaxID=1467 RepID=UPI00203B69B0|nr:Gfo/Idh/MocA family oxidoreductase [Lederbergia lenta]MCM3110767.1 Gfo/Idh/MocA family oxidoreductase [Lederbergia lenta]